MNKKNSIPIKVFALTALLAVSLMPNLWADDVSGADRLLCASLEATRCSLDG